MKKKLLTIFLMAVLTLSIVACGDSGESENSNGAETTTGSKSEATEEPKDDGVINFEDGDYKVVYTKHEIGEDYEGNPCLLFYYEYTNNGEEASNALVDAYIQCFQNGVECEVAVLFDENEGINNSMKDVQPGVSIEACNAYVLTDMSDVTIEASNIITDEKDVQTITLE